MIGHELVGEMIEADRFIILLIIVQTTHCQSYEGILARGEWISCLSSHSLICISDREDLQRIETNCVWKSKLCNIFPSRMKLFRSCNKILSPCNTFFRYWYFLRSCGFICFVHRACIYWILWKMIIRLSPISNFDTIFLAHKNWEAISSAILQFSI